VGGKDRASKKWREREKEEKERGSERMDLSKGGREKRNKGSHGD
jgi:hypothetical protein